MTRPADAAAAAQAGARWIGVVFAGGPRLLTSAAAARVLAEVPPGVGRVGVFGRESLTTILRAVEALRLDAVQLHAAGTERLALALGARGIAVWRVARLVGPDAAAQIARTAVGAAVLLAEPRVEGRAGGAGVPLDLRLAAAARRAVPAGTAFALAGGLTPETVRRAVASVRPDIVDVSTGVEASVGIKDVARMRAFVREAMGGVAA